MNPGRELYLGLDLTSSAGRASTVALLDGLLRLIALDFLSDDAQILAEIERYRPALVAIDAPLSLPLGLDCLEEAHLCRPLSEAKGRLCERQLSKMGIGSYYTTKRSIIKPMIYRAMALKGELERRGFSVIEIYPYATRSLLFPRNRTPKVSREGRRRLQEGLRRLIRGLPASRSNLLSHDQLDALLAAYTGFLFVLGRARGIGDPAEGRIYVPAL